MTPSPPDALSPEPLPLTDVELGPHRLAYHDSGRGRPVVFLHGNPTSSYLWRNVVPTVARHARCIAPDLLGHGSSSRRSDAGPEGYRFVEHRDVLDAFLEALDVGDGVVLVAHDWGSALAFDWARRHADRVAGIAFLEGIVRPMTWDERPAGSREFFQALRSAEGERLVLEDNLLVEGMPSAILRDLSDEEHDAYRRPFAGPGESRRPALTWARELPIDGQPADVVEIVGEYASWLAETSVPKLLVRGEPGDVLTAPLLETVRSWPQLTEAAVPGLHFLPEDSPFEIAEALVAWLGDVIDR